MLKISSFKKFLDNTEKKHIVCFGVGKYITNLYHFNCNQLLSRINILIDNNKEKQGKKYILNGKVYDIMHPSVLQSLDSNKYIILITCLAEEVLLKQLEEDEQLSKFDVYCLRHFNVLFNDYLALQKKVPENLRISDRQLIPKKIHYCWFGKKPIPDCFNKYMESWREHCPDYEIIEWNESNYDVTKNNFMKEAYQLKKWGFVTDYARMDIIYNEGGIYLDTDVEIIQNIDDLLYQKGFMGFQDSYWVASGLGFGAVAGLPIIKNFRDTYNNLIFDVKNISNLTCPKIQTEDLRRKGLVPNGECQIIDDLTIYPEKMLCGKSYSTMQVSLAPYTRMIHHFAGSWCDAEVLKRVDDRTKVFADIKE